MNDTNTAVSGWCRCLCGDRLPFPDDDHHGPTIGICGHTGATWETLMSVLCQDFSWNVVVYLKDGSTREGRAERRTDDVLTLAPSPCSHCGSEMDWPVENVPFDQIIHIQIT